MPSFFSKSNNEAARRLQRGIERGLEKGVITEVTPTGGVTINVRKMLEQPKVRRQMEEMAKIRVG
ncbi:MAG: hypothetical protein KKC01_08070 [Gammaproteobacteria bacterium]|nr:hypothetical protein [Gammaproteobacteria bacterium]